MGRVDYINCYDVCRKPNAECVLKIGKIRRLFMCQK